MSEKQSITSSLNTFGHEDLKGFASYLGMEYEELLEVQKKNTEVLRNHFKSNED